MKNYFSNFKLFLTIVLLTMFSLLSCNNNNTNPVADKLLTVKIEKTSDSNNVIKVESPIENDNISINVYPNPCKTTFQVRFSLPSDLPVAVTIENIVGDKIIVLLNNFLSAGEYICTADVLKFGLKPGIYMVHLQIDNYSERQYFEVIS